MNLLKLPPCRFSRLVVPTLFLVCLGIFSARAGGPLFVGGPNLGTDGVLITWDSSTPVPYRMDGGPLSTTPDGVPVIDFAAASSRISSMFQVWEDVPTASITYSNEGVLLNTGVFTDGDVDTLEELVAVFNSCDAGEQSPIISDADGSMFLDLFNDPGVIGFAGACSIDSSTGHIRSALAVMNGQFQDGIENFNTNNFELTADEFDQAFVHEFGHFSGLDHSQINSEVLSQQPGACLLGDLEGLPLMFPFLWCQDRKSAGLPILATDDLVWISKLYPSASFSSQYGTISGTILFSDGITHAQGVNVIARETGNPRGVAVSAVSGYLFTGNPGQDVTADYLPCDPASACPGGFAGNNSGGNPLGSRNPLRIGYFEISVPPGTYTVEVESVKPFFAGGSGVGPLSPPIPNPGPDEKWNLNETSEDVPADSNIIPVSAGQLVPDINIILNETGLRFDSLEDSNFSSLRPNTYFHARFRRSSFSRFLP